MAEELKVKKVPRCDRITLDKQSLEKVNCWHEQLNNHLKHAKVSKSDLVNWCINEFAEALSHENLIKLEAKFFDPVRALEWAAKQAKLAKIQGQSFDLQDFLKQSLSAPKSVRKSQTRISKPKTEKLEGNPNECYDPSQT